MRDPATPEATRLNACLCILERDWGKPKETHEPAQPNGAQSLQIEIVDAADPEHREQVTIEMPREVAIGGQPAAPAALGVVISG